MRVIRSVVLVTVIAASGSVVEGQAPDAAQVLAAARVALGGEKILGSVKTFSATGRTRQIRGNNLVPIEFELSGELPDKFVRTEHIPAQGSEPTTSGFSGTDLIQVPAPTSAPGGARGGGPGGPGASPAPTGSRVGAVNPVEQRLTTMKQDFARLMLGVFATSFASYPLTFTYVAQGEAPEGKADILDVSGPPPFSARLVVQRDTHLPVMLMWQVPATTVLVRSPGQPVADSLPPGTVTVEAPAPPASTASQEERDHYAAAVATLRREALSRAKPVEHRLYYADFRDVQGVKWPFRLRRAIAGETIEETTFDRVRLNVRIDPRMFEAPK